jgi:hypothetical protein
MCLCSNRRMLCCEQRVVIVAGNMSWVERGAGRVGEESVMNGTNEGKVYIIVSEFRVLSRALTNESKFVFMYLKHRRTLLSVFAGGLDNTHPTPYRSNPSPVICVCVRKCSSTRRRACFHDMSTIKEIITSCTFTIRHPVQLNYETNPITKQTSHKIFLRTKNNEMGKNMC